MFIPFIQTWIYSMISVYSKFARVVLKVLGVSIFW